MSSSHRKYYQLQLDTSKAPESRIFPNVFDYSDLSSFLKAYRDQKLAQSPQWSLGVWSRKLGLKGSGTLSNIISGNRAPSIEVVEKMKEDFKFTDYEGTYFDALAMGAIKNVSEKIKSMLRSRIFELTIGKEYRELSDEICDVLSDPLAMILREVVCLEKF